MSGWVAAHCDPMINADAALDLFDTEVESMVSALAIPCTIAGDRRGVVALYSARRDAFEAVHERLVHAAVALLATPDQASNVVDIQERSVPARPRPLAAAVQVAATPGRVRKR
jgi:hypothetical protein